MSKVKKAVKYFWSHKIVSLVIIVAAGGAYFIFFGGEKSVETSYVLGEVSRGNIISSVSASGQVSSLEQIDIKPKVSGDIIWVGVKEGDTVRAGQAIAQIDSTEAKQNILDAEQTLAQAKLQYQKDVAQAPIDYEKLQEALLNAQKNLVTTYNDTFNTVSDAYLSLPTVMTGMQSALYGYDLSQTRTQWNIDVIENIFSSLSSNAEYEAIKTLADITRRDYTIAREKYDASLIQYKQLTRYSENDQIEVSLESSADTATAIAQSLQSALNLFDTAIDYAGQRNTPLSPSVNTMRSSVQSYLSTTNSRLSSILSQITSLESAKKSVRDSERTIEIYEIGNPTGDRPISLQSSSLNIANQERNLKELKDNLSYYTITAPFSGTVTSFDIKKFDTVSIGATVATVITSQKIATLSLNEVDAAKIKAGNKATLTFDAIENLTLTGEVTLVDAVGSVSQGVVSYSVKISFDSQDDRVKPGMTVNAAIITDISQNVLAVPSSAVKTQGIRSYVLAFDPPLTETGGIQGIVPAVPPQEIDVEVGISSDTSVEITSGLLEGQQIVVRTINSGAATNSTVSNNAGFGGQRIRF